MERMIKADMRLMCLDKGTGSRIGWAANGARLNDQVVLIPGCSIPAILRQNEEGTFRMVGEAVVDQSMWKEMVQNAKTEDFQHIDIL